MNTADCENHFLSVVTSWLKSIPQAVTLLLGPTVLNLNRNPADGNCMVYSVATGARQTFTVVNNLSHFIQHLYI